jgi:hypothetical protein
MQSKKELEEVLEKAKTRVHLCPTLRLHLEAKVLLFTPVCVRA